MCEYRFVWIFRPKNSFENTSKLVKEQNLSDSDLITEYGANLVLGGSITVYGTNVRTSFELTNFKR